MNDDLQSAQSDESRSAEIPSALQDKTLGVWKSSAAGSPESKAGVRPRKRPPAEPEKKNEPADKFASDVHTYIRQYIQFADQKASFLFAGVASMIAFLHGKGITKLWFKDPRQWHIPDALSFITVTGLLLGAILAVFVILPRLGGAARGIVFWNAITLFENGKDYATHVQKCDPAELASAKLEHCHELARVCQRKYRLVGWALWCGGIGLVASVFHLAVY
ncbi:MAG: Pycsar system effector family protein [Roseimicrobium sp.]